MKQTLLKIVIFATNYILATGVREQIRIRVINQNMAFHWVHKQMFQTLNDDFEKHLKETGNQTLEDPDIIIVATQEVNVIKTDIIGANLFQNLLLTNKKRDALINGYRMVKSFGLFTHKTFVFFKKDLVVEGLCHIGKRIISHFEKYPLKNIIAQKGGVSAVLQCGSIRTQIVSMHLPARYLGVLERIKTYEALYGKLKMLGLFHTQFVVGDLNSRSDFQNHDELMAKPLSELSRVYRNDDSIKKEEREKDNMENLLLTMNIQLPDNKVTKERIPITFKSLRHKGAIGKLYDHDQLRICMNRGFMFETFKDLIITGAPSYRLSDGSPEQSSDWVGYSEQTPRPNEGERVYLKSQSISWPDRILYNALHGLEDMLEVTNLETYAPKDINSDHAATATQFTVKVGMVEEALKDVSNKQYKLKLDEKIQDDNNIKQIKVLEVNLVMKRNSKFHKDLKNNVWKLQDGNKEEIENKKRFSLVTNEFTISEYVNTPTNIVRFEIDLELDHVKDLVVVNIWIGNLKAKEHNKRWEGLGVNTKGHVMFEVKLEQV
eukprot:GAHX01000973.1.p1 GENE.GAHX01000973.1~~GAHX01000973.1.p1  ORF type:complete len:547 (-),score=99.13 GAHX01000973.1:1349-2989(-)